MQKERILIIDDNLTNLKLLKVVITLEGYDVRTAMDASAAEKVLIAFQPHLILMDLQLPGMDGFELTRKLKQDPRYQNILIVAVTAYAMKGDEEKALAAGCDGYIAKPIDTQQLPKLISAYLTARRLND